MRTLLACLTCVAMVGVALDVRPRAQETRPDFTGTWVVESVDVDERPSSEPGNRGGGGFGRGGFGGGGFGGGRQDGGARSGGDGSRGGREGQPPEGSRLGFARYEVGQRIRIRQTADNLIVTIPTASGEQMKSYPFDGRETSDAGEAAGVKSKTTWEGAAIVTDTARQISGGRGNVTLKTREVRSISADGLTMTVRVTEESPNGRMTTNVTCTQGEG